MWRGAGPTQSSMPSVSKKAPRPYVWSPTSHDWTWPRIVQHCIDHLGPRDVSLASIYAMAQSHDRVIGRAFWRERIRATLEAGSFVRTGEGLWSSKAGYTDRQIAHFERLRRKRWPLLGPREK